MAKIPKLQRKNGEWFVNCEIEDEMGAKCTKLVRIPKSLSRYITKLRRENDKLRGQIEGYQGKAKCKNKNVSTAECP
ncbi:MAG: hypothetical protein ACXABY_14335 [Candidatus Thorarchaeota archaeon]|jgi:hypothetical protein